MRKLLGSVCRTVASLRDATSQRWLVGPLQRADLTAFLGAAALLTAAAASAHHSFATYYFEDQSISIEGAIDVFDLRAPHAWVYVMAPDGEGRLQRFAAEWANPTRLRGNGITRATLKAGDHVIITGSPGRIPSEYKIHLKRIQRPADGWEWRGGRRGRRR